MFVGPKCFYRDAVNHDYWFLPRMGLLAGLRSAQSAFFMTGYVQGIFPGLLIGSFLLFTNGCHYGTR